MGYADKATLIGTAENPSNREAVTKSLQRDLVRIDEWCSVYGMKLNHSKTKTPIVSSSRTVGLSFPALSLNGIVLVKSPHLEILGVIFDAKLTFEWFQGGFKVSFSEDRHNEACLEVVWLSEAS